MLTLVARKRIINVPNAENTLNKNELPNKANHFDKCGTKMTRPNKLLFV
jgi:hypothetical protein